jgi:hypothetical protein
LGNWRRLNISRRRCLNNRGWIIDCRRCVIVIVSWIIPRVIPWIISRPKSCAKAEKRSAIITVSTMVSSMVSSPASVPTVSTSFHERRRKQKCEAQDYRE